MAILKNTTVTDNGYIQIPSGPTAQRPSIISNIIQWTNTGTQTYAILAGNTPTLTNTSWTAPTGVTQVEVLVVAGGGGAGFDGNGAAGGGGAGGVIYNTNFPVTPGNSYTVTVGAGGAAGAVSGNPGSNGSNSVFGTLTAIGGGNGSVRAGSGSGGSSGGTGDGTNGSVWTVGSFTAGQGFPGANTPLTLQGGGGGGGAGGPGNSGAANMGGGGGPGLNFSISGTPTWYAGGGGGAAYTSSQLGGNGGSGVGGNGGKLGTSSTAGAASTGSGGGGGGSNNSSITGSAGGSGIVIIRYSITTTNVSPIGMTRFNTESKILEIYQGTIQGWVAQDATRNFGGHNLFAYSSTFTNASWLGNNSTVASNSTIAPDGTGNVYTATPTTGNTAHQLYHQTGVVVIAVPYTFSIYLKANGYTEAKLADVSTGNGVWFNLSTGVVGTATAGFVGTIVSAGNSWYRCSITFTPSAGTQNYGIYIGNTTETAFFAGDGTSGVFVWGAQLEQATSAGPYVKTLGANSPIPTVQGGYRLHTYTTTGTSGFTAANTGVVDVLVVGGGGAGSYFGGGGGGGGGVIYQQNYAVLSGQSYTVIVGAGGINNSGAGAGGDGSNSKFAGLVGIGGGIGGFDGRQCGNAGGSGGGGATMNLSQCWGGAGVFGQGFPGGDNGGGVNDQNYSAGGGGAGGPGRNVYSAAGGCGTGGPGVACAISGTLQYYGGGGGGAPRNSGTQSTGAPGGIGGGGAGSTSSAGATGTSGTTNTGGGGGGGVGYPSNAAGGNGGSGIVIVRYRYD